MIKVVDVATVTKLTRYLFIIVIIPMVSYLYYMNSNTAVKGEKVSNLPKWYKFIPLFVIGFLFFAFIRTLGDLTLENYGKAFGILQQKRWENIYITRSEERRVGKEWRSRNEQTSG